MNIRLHHVAKNVVNESMALQCIQAVKFCRVNTEFEMASTIPRPCMSCVFGRLIDNAESAWIKALFQKSGHAVNSFVGHFCWFLD